MSILKKLAGETAIYGISSIIGRLLNLILTPFFTNIFEKTGQGSFLYGILSYFYAYIAFANVFLTFGMETAFFRFSEDHKDAKRVYNQAFFWVWGLALSVMLLGILFHEPLASLTEYGDRSNLVLMTIIIICIDAMAALPMAKLRHEGRAKRFAIINLINIGISLLANVIFLAILDKGIEYIFVSNIIASTVRLGLALPTGLPDGFRIDRKELWAMGNYGLFIMIAGLAGMMNETLDRILIPELWVDGTIFNGIARTGEELNGMYAGCYKLSMFIALATQAFRYAAEPFFFKQAKDKNSPETFAKVFHYFLLLTLAAFLFVSSFSQEIVGFNFFGIFGPEVTFIPESYWEALTVVPILLLAYVFSAAYINLSIWFKITKQTRFALLFAGAGALVTVVINVLTIPRFGYVGSAWATLACYSVMCFLCYTVGQKYYPIPYRVQRLFIYALVFLGAFAINLQIGPTNGFFLAFLSKFLVCGAAVGAVYVGEKYYGVF